MKQIAIALTVVMMTGFLACSSKQNDSKADEPAEKKISPLEGSWVTVSFEQNGKISHPKRVPQQFKMFHDGFFSLVMYDDDGKFYLAGAGPYEITGDTYKETFPFHSDTAYIGFKNWQKWELKGDTLIFYGFEKAEKPDGSDVTKEWNSNGKFIEKRIRATK
jgi:hypothetical protein